MSLFAFLGAAETQPFSVAGAVVLLLLLVELGGLLLGGSSAGAALDDWLGLDHDAAVGHEGGHEGEAEAAGPLAGALSWLNFGRLPTLVALILLLGCFACVGLGLQGLALQFGGTLVSAWVMALPAAIGGGLAAHWLGGRLARLLPREESYAISPNALVGRIGRLTIGPVDGSNAGRAVVTDDNGNRHNVRVLAGPAEARFETGSAVLLATRQGEVFLVTAVPPGMLTSPPTEAAP